MSKAARAIGNVVPGLSPLTDVLNADSKDEDISAKLKEVKAKTTIPPKLDIFLRSIKPIPGIGQLADPPEETIQALKNIYATAKIPSEVIKDLGKEILDSVPDPKTKSTFLNFTLGIPKATAEIITQMTAETVTPEALAFIGGMKYGLKPLLSSDLAKTFGTKIVNSIPEKVKSFFTYKYNAPDLYIDLIDKSKQALEAGLSPVLNIAKQFYRMPMQDRLIAGKYLRGELAKESVPQSVLSLADEARDRFVNLGRESVSLGLLGEDVWKRNLETYFPRLYEFYEKGKKGIGGFFTKANRITLDRFKVINQNLDPEIRDSLGEILEAGYPTIKGLSQLTQAVERAKFFKSIADNPRWAITPAKSLNESAYEQTSEALFNGFKELPESKSLGALSGKLVHPGIYDDIQESIRIKSDTEKLYGKFLSKWKKFKTIYNPATHIRNSLFNTVLLDWSGVGFSKQPGLLLRAAKEIGSKGDLYKEALASNAVGGEFSSAELKNLTSALLDDRGSIINFIGKYSDNLASIMQKAKFNFNQAENFLGKAYQMNDKLFKVAKFIDGIDNGLTPKLAAEEAQTWLFNYDQVSPFIDKLRKAPLGSPFITFTSKAVPKMLQTALNNPMKIYKYYAMQKGIENITKEKLGLSDSNLDAIHKQQGFSIVLPVRDRNKIPVTLPLTYFSPLSDIGQTGGFLKLPSWAPPSGPMRTFLELVFNKSVFTGMPIYNNQTDTPYQAMQKITDYFGKQMLPALTPGIPGKHSPFKGGYSYEKILNGLKDIPEDYRYRGVSIPRRRTMGMILADTLGGIKLTPTDPTIIKSKNINRKLSAFRDLSLDFEYKASKLGTNKEDAIKDYISKTRKLFNE